MTPTVSVIVAVYNTATYLPETLASLERQTLGLDALQVILVDDGSSDASPAICDRFAQQEERVIVVHRENGGIGAAQNSGLDAASGELITFCDNDDLMSPRLVERLVTILIEADADMSCCRWLNVGSSVAEETLRKHSADPDGRVITFTQPGRYYQEVFSVLLRKLRHRELYYFSEANSCAR